MRPAPDCSLCFSSGVLLKAFSERKALLLTILTMVAILSPGSLSFAEGGVSGVFNVREFGAKGDGQTPDTEAIEKAIAACVQAGGGQVLLPPGQYLSGTVRLRSNMTLKLDAGARLAGSSDLAQYRNPERPKQMPESVRWDGPWNRALLLLENVENVTIVGEGVVDGRKVLDPNGEEKMRGPHAIVIVGCRGVTLRDFEILDAANYGVLMWHCERVGIRDLEITGGWDGVHFREGRDISIVGCRFFTGDDSIAGRDWHDVLISGCVVNSSCNGIRLIGPAENLIIHDCLFYGPGKQPHRTSNRHNMLAAINLQPGAWEKTEGRFDNVLISDITVQNTQTPLHVCLRPGNSGGRLEVNRLTATGTYGCAVSVESWDEKPLENVVLRGLNLEFAGGEERPANPASVSQPSLDARKLPVWGFYGRNIRNLRLTDVRFSTEKPDPRSVGFLEAVDRLTLDAVRYPVGEGGTEPFVLEKVKDIQIYDPNPSNLPKREPWAM